MDFEELAERCEQAEGAYRELDHVIGIAVGAFHKDSTRDGTTIWHDGLGRLLTPYTASIDAALTLVPEAGFVELNVFFGNSEGGIDEAIVWPKYGEEFCTHGAAKSPALALCAAALRARSLTPPSTI